DVQSHILVANLDTFRQRWHAYSSPLSRSHLWRLVAASDGAGQEAHRASYTAAVGQTTWSSSRAIASKFTTEIKSAGCQVLPLSPQYVFELAIGEHDTYYTIQKFKTFTPASRDRAFVFAQLSKNIENACIKARKYKLAAQRVVIYLRTQ